jgi:hypothetical protein
MNTEHYAGIIREAASSPLGVLALIVLVLSSLAVVFFGKSSEKARMTVWSMMFVGALLFGFTMLRARASEPRLQDERAREDVARPVDEVVDDERAEEAEEEEADGPRRASILLAYGGDQYGCMLPLTFSIGDRSIQPQGRFARFDDLPPGRQTYRITGSINCPTIGACSVDSEGVLEVADGRTYDLVWQNTSFGLCDAILRPGA